MRPETLLAQTDWSTVAHAYAGEPREPSTPQILAALLDLVPALDAFLGRAPFDVYAGDWGTRLRARVLPTAASPASDRQALLDVVARRCFGPDALPRHLDFDARDALTDLVPEGAGWLERAGR